MPGDPAVDGITPLAEFDAESATWVRSLTGAAERREAARNAIYKTLFDARRKLRAALAADGYLDDQTSRRS